MKKVALSLMGILTALTLITGVQSNTDSKPASPTIMMMEHGDHGG
ncbi:Phr family secreted Rap phosphatase inhibitor [Bacillus cereus]|nr:Phr family secreted Rap phosphatase inhibitor [Bacillus cereus]MCC3687528.1 Phr family secreted Rap phosphatase inhibitor [Bacillus cereus]